jgi:hypothetical protein
MLAHDLWSVAEDVSDFLKTCAAPKQPGRKGVPESVRPGIFHAGFLEHS